jgi:uncharacterized Zn-binding protein involved in type VI secretion
MPAVCRLGDISTGHGCFPPRPNTSARSTVFADGIPVHCKGDSWATHNCGNSSHDGVLIGASSSASAEGKGLGRTGDAISCGDTVAEGSPTVFSG